MIPNISLSRNIFPDIMKCAEVSPIFKKDDYLLKGNFRPVSILTSISKIYENVVNNQLLGHFYEIFNDLLSAFRKGHSCQLLLLKFVEYMKNALDQKHAVGALFMDLSKAFDCLPHGLLVAKLHAYGLTPRRLLPTWWLPEWAPAAGQNIRCQKWMGNSRQGCASGIYLGTLTF